MGGSDGCQAVVYGIESVLQARCMVESHRGDEVGERVTGRWEANMLRDRCEY